MDLCTAGAQAEVGEATRGWVGCGGWEHQPTTGNTNPLQEASRGWVGCGGWERQPTHGLLEAVQGRVIGGNSKGQLFDGALVGSYVHLGLKQR